MTKQEKNKLIEFRGWLVSETERFHDMSNADNASNAGKHYCRGNADGFIRARAELEKVFHLWD